MVNASPAQRPAGRGKIGRFRSDDAKQRFDRAYDAALASWGVETSGLDIPTEYGVTRVNRCGATTGTPIVLLPSMLATSTSWAPNIAALGEGHPIYAIDVICDAGRSTQERPVRDGHDLQRWFDDLLVGLQIDVAHVVGLSFGAFIALNQSLRSPAKLRSVTAIEPPGAITRGRLRLLLTFVRSGIRRTDRDFERVITALGNGRRPPPEVVDVLHCGFRGYKLALPFAKLLTDDELRSMLTPTLLLFGAESPMSDGTRAVDRAKRLLPHVEAELVARTAHTPPMEAPDVVNARILRFVAEVEAGRDPS
jgi:pimeloyl-ACP methyl ester carboxylesterase